MSDPGLSPAQAAGADPGGGQDELSELVRAVASSAARSCVQDRPVSIEWQGPSGDAAVAVAHELSRRLGPRFHLDCLCASSDEARLQRRIAARSHVDDLLSASVAPEGRDHGDCDVYVLVDLLGRPDAAARLARLASRLSSSSPGGSVLVVLDSAQGQGDQPSSEALAVLGRLFRDLPPWLRYDACSGVLIDDPALLSRPFSPPPPLPPLELLSRQLDFLHVTGFGGLVAWLTAPPLGGALDPARPIDRAFLAHAAALEARLRAARALPASRFVATLVAKGQAPSPVDPHRALRAEKPLPDLEGEGFVFPERVEVVSHTLSGDEGSAVLADGFYYFEPDRGVRWSGPTFTLHLDLPLLPRPLSCELELVCVRSEHNAGGATVSVDGAPVARIEDVSQILTAPDPRLVVSFPTRGGPTDVTVALDEPTRPTSHADSRDLGVVIRRISATLPRE